MKRFLTSRLSIPGLLRDGGGSEMTDELPLSNKIKLPAQHPAGSKLSTSLPIPTSFPHRLLAASGPSKGGGATN